MKKTCVVFIGLQASGKTSFYQQRFSGLAHVNLDALHTRGKENRLLEECFASEKSFVVDNTNPTRKDRARYIGAAREHGYRVVGFYFQSSISACIERNSRREAKARLPVSALAAAHRILELPVWEEGFDELYYVCVDQDRFAVEPWKNDV